jgi:UDP-N-acetyl-D-mannosaminuronate dehydrogenase
MNGMDVIGIGAAGLQRASTQMAKAAQDVVGADGVKQTLGVVALKAAQQQQVAMLEVVQAGVEATRDLLRATGSKLDLKA